MEFLLLLGLFLAAQHAFKHAKQNRQAGRASRLSEVAKRMPGGVSRSRRGQVVAVHGAGWWAGEALHGFPVHRRGWHAGWLAHQAAAEQQKAIREEARTTHLETRQSFAEQLREHKERQARAVAAIDNFTAVHGEPEGKAGREAVREAVLADVVPIRRDLPELPADPEPGAPGSPSDFRSPWAEPGPYATRRVDGKPETDGDRKFFDARESGYDGPWNWVDGQPADPDSHEAQTLRALRDTVPDAADSNDPKVPDGPSVPAGDITDWASATPATVSGVHAAAAKASADNPGRPVSIIRRDGPGGEPRRDATYLNGQLVDPSRISSAATTTNGGDPVPNGTQSETTYSQTNADFDALANEAEAEIARLQLSRIPAMIEALSNAGIGGGAMDALDGAQGSVEAQIKAAQEQLDYAQAAKSAHVREHGQGHEYHAGAENGGAEKSYLQE